MNTTFELATQEAQRYINEFQIKLDDIPDYKPIKGYFCADPCSIKNKRVGYYFFVEDDNEIYVAHSFCWRLIEAQEYPEHHKLVLNTIISYLNKITNNNVSITGWRDDNWKPTDPNLPIFLNSLI